MKRSAHSWIRVRAFALALTLSALTACPKVPPPDPGPETAVWLTEETIGALNCPRHDCVKWYKVETPTRGDLAVFVEIEEAGQFPPLFYLALTDTVGRSVVNQPSRHNAVANLSSRVAAGVHLIKLSSERPGKPFTYRVGSFFDPYRPPPPPPKPPIP